MRTSLHHMVICILMYILPIIWYNTLNDAVAE